MHPTLTGIVSAMVAREYNGVFCNSIEKLSRKNEKRLHQKR